MNRRFRLLVVDDEPLNIKVISAAFRDKYDVVTALNGHDAISLLKESSPDLILLDVMMPEVSGFDVCKIIKANPEYADLPIIFLTAMDTHEGALLGLGFGGIDYLTKPVDLDLLKLRVHNHLELKEQYSIVKEQRDQLARQKKELETALARIRSLEGIIPICYHCKKIRNDQNYWQGLEQYLSEHSEAVFSHGLCPECYEREMQLVNEMKASRKKPD